MAVQNIVPTTEPSPLEIVRQLSSLDQKAIVRPNNPPPGVAGFLFDIDMESAVSLRSDITTHYVEDNLPVQDQIALTPERVTVRGLVAELRLKNPTLPSVTTPTNPLPLVAALMPVFSPGEAETMGGQIATAENLARSVKASDSLYTFYRNRAPTQPNQTRQSAAFLYFYALWKARQLFTVETPWGFFVNMAIESLDVSQPEDTKYMSDFSITFMLINVAKDITVDLGQLAGRNAPQLGASQPTQNGNAGETDISLSAAEKYKQYRGWTPTN